MPATNLRDAMNILDPEHSLETEEELRQYFVMRPNSPIEDIKILLESERPQKILFSGHRGAGKTTELAKLALELPRNEYFVVRFSVKQVLDLFDLTYVDVLLSMGLELYAEALKQKIPIRKDILENFLRFGQDIAQEEQKEVVGSVEVEVDVGNVLTQFLGRLKAKLGAEAATRKTVRETVRHRLSDLMLDMGILVREIEQRTKRRVLVIVEDLDKTDLGTARELFCDYAKALQAPPVSIIYTFPIALRHDREFGQVAQNFSAHYILPNLKPCTRKSGQPYENDLEQLRQILTHRVDPEQFESDTLELLAMASGGLIRELIALARFACVEARKARRNRITTFDVEGAIINRRNDYQVLIDRSQRARLREVHRTRQVENTEEDRLLLHYVSVLEYRNREVWYDVHPLVLPLLETED